MNIFVDGKKYLVTYAKRYATYVLHTTIHLYGLHIIVSLLYGVCWPCSQALPMCKQKIERKLFPYCKRQKAGWGLGTRLGVCSSAISLLSKTNICDPLSENPALRANIEFELEAILSVQVVSKLNSDYCTNVSQGACTVSC